MGDEPSDVYLVLCFVGAEIQELTVLEPPSAYPNQAESQPPPAQSPWGQPAVQQQQAPQADTFGSNPWGQTAQASVRSDIGSQQGTGTTLPAPAPAPTVSVASVATEQPAKPKSKPLSYAHAAGGTTPSSRPPTGYQGGRQYSGGRGGRGNGHMASGRGGRGGRGGHAPPPPPPQPITIPKEEFDFEESLSKFDKDKIAQEAGAHIPSKDDVYKKDDFFDSLSCDALERQQNANDRHARMAQQRRTDVATFGTVARQNQHRGRGRGRGRGGQRHTTTTTGK